MKKIISLTIPIGLIDHLFYCHLFISQSLRGISTTFDPAR